MRQFDIGELERRIDEVLYYVWDPVGVADVPYARGEYRKYIPEVLKLVASSRNLEDTAALSSYLLEIMQKRLSLRPDPGRCEHAARVLLKHKRAVLRGLA